MKVKKIAIIGCSPDYVNAPYDGDWQIWSLGRNYATIPRYDRWFEMHTLDIVKAGSHSSIIDFFRSAGDKLYAGHVNDEIPEAKIYPVEIVSNYRGYMTSSIAYMIAMAIEEGATEIGIWGIDMTGDGEYIHQRPACEYLLGLAEGKGIKITLSAGCPLLQTQRLYALEFSALSNEISQTVNDIDRAIEAANHEIMKAEYYKGQKAGLATAREIITRMKRRWG